jgi:hypothetical protein
MYLETFCGINMSMTEIKVPESDKYFVNSMFVGGFALLSFVGGVMLESVKIASLDLFSLGTSVLVLLAVVAGLVFLSIGWYTLGNRELRNGKSA